MPDSLKVQPVDANGNPLTGVAGTPAGGVNTVQGSATGTPIPVTLATLIAGENQTANRLMVMPNYTPTYIVTATTTVVRTGAGVLHTVCINKAVASATVTIYDNTAGSGTILGIITMPAVLLNSQAYQLYDVAFAIGCTIVTVGAQDITVSTAAA